MTKDYFSKNAKLYSQHRPTYPQALFDFIFDQVSNKEYAWDCATGNGQAARELAKEFERVVATDISHKQIENAPKIKNIEYEICPAEKTNLEASSVDLVTVAQAIHWFDIPKFYEEVRRVLKPGGIIAIWAYPKADLVEPILNSVFLEFFEMLWEKECWPWERKYVDDGYTKIPFLFEEIAAPDFYLEFEQNFEEFIGYVKTWSSVSQYEKKFGENPVEKILVPKMREAWGNLAEKKKLQTKLTVKIGKV